MQPENPMLSMLRLAVAETRAVLGQRPHNASLERDMARLCWIMTLQGGRLIVARACGMVLRGGGLRLHARASSYRARKHHAAATQTA